ncbi:XylR family transcriptional regulator [Haloferula helveola]|uniref:XylR family transcriptional regulator n=1 Tax=Haloferula helveola TaxID=490095 RepID=A0ABN6HB50_9BACT|nr:XylR family transcriptional regulator [Haloferula helveola]
MPPKRSRAKRSATKCRVAIILDLDWPYKRQIDVYHGILEQCERFGWDPILIPLAEGIPTEHEPFENRKGLPFDGIIARATSELAVEAKSAGIPLVNVWMNSPAYSDVPTVSVELEATARRAARHLVARGLRNLAYLGARRLRDCRFEYAGMRSAAKENGCSISRLLIDHNYNRTQTRWEQYQAELHQWIDRLEVPFGVFAYNDLQARYIIEACRRKGLRVPEDVAVIGCGNELPLCLQPSPTITSMEHGFFHVGVRSVEILAELMDGAKPPSEPLLLENTIQLIARQSTDSFAVDDPLVSTALRYISENCHKPINVADVVNHVPASRRSLERRFTEVLNRSIAAELCRLRVRRLERLLIDSDEPLAMLADSCGFLDTEQMRRNFHRLHGVTPSEYRKKLKS